MRRTKLLWIGSSINGRLICYKVVMGHGSKKVCKSLFYRQKKQMLTVSKNNVNEMMICDSLATNP